MGTVSASTRNLPLCMTIAGSDSGGGAGIQADLRTFAALGVYGSSVLTAVTAQNPLQVTAVDSLSPEIVRAQFKTVCDVMVPDVIKSGMLSSREIVETVAECLQEHPLPYVVDPVMISTSGKALLREDALEVLTGKLLHYAHWITPNIPEAEVLCGRKICNTQDALECAKLCAERWNCSILLKGGHAQGDWAGDIAVFQDKAFLLETPRVPVRVNADHGTGCTLSAALTAFLAKGYTPLEALLEAKAFVLGSLSEQAVIGGKEQYAMYYPQCGTAPYRKLIRYQEL